MRLKHLAIAATIASQGLFMVSAAHAAPETFAQAKKILPKIYSKMGVTETVYCGCDFTVKNKYYSFDADSCGLKARKQAKRSTRTEWEHVLPAYHFGHQLQCWQEGGRKNCTKNNPEFSVMEGDLFNLLGSEGEMNGDRSNFSYGMIPGEARNYGQCDFEVDFKARVAEPRESVRGDLARINFYMIEQYGLSMSSQQRKLFEAWDKMDPVDAEECKLNKLKAQYQGHDNPFVMKHCR